MRLLFPVLGLVAALSGMVCLPVPATAGNTGKIREAIEILETANPEKDVHEAVAGGDLRFLGIRGFTTIVPGIDKFDEKYLKAQGVRIILTTRDFVKNRDLERLNLLATRYAHSYNRLLLERIRSLPAPQPSR